MLKQNEKRELKGDLIDYHHKVRRQDKLFHLCSRYMLIHTVLQSLQGGNHGFRQMHKKEVMDLCSEVWL